VKRAGLPVLLGLLALLLAAACALSAFGFMHVGGLGGTRAGWGRFTVVAALFLATAAAGAWLPAHRFRLLLAASLAQLVFLHGPVGAAGALAIWTAFYHVVHLRASWWLRAPAVAALFVAPHLLTLIAPGSRLLGVFMVAHFASNFVYRSTLYAYEATAKKALLQGAGYKGYLLYLIAAPMGIVQAPPVGFAVLHQRFRSETDLGVMRRGLAWIALGFLYLLLNHTGRRYGLIPAHQAVAAYAGELDALTVLAASHLVFLGLFLDLAGHIHVAVGMLSVLGFDIPAGSDRPYLSKNILVFWRRWNVYYRDLLMTLAYYPTAVALKRKPYLAVAAAGAATFLLSGFYHSLLEYVSDPAGMGPRRFFEPQIVLYALGSLVVVWMIREARRSRKHSPRASHRKEGGGATAGRLRAAAAAAFTLTVVSLIYTVFRRPYDGTPLRILGAFTRAPW